MSSAPDRRAFKVGDRVELAIEKMAVGGRGVARLDGAVFFVDRAAPGDRVLARITQAKKNFAEADVEAVLQPGPSRVDPPCSYFGQCGGCSWQHLAYDEQLVQKRLLVEESLRKHSGYRDVVVAPTIPSPREFRYRNRIQLHIGLSGEVGFRARRSATVVDVKDCLITDEALAAELVNARTEIQSGAFKPSERFELRLTAEGRTVRGGADAATELGFAQVNVDQNEALVKWVVERFAARSAAHRSSIEVVWDLYAGFGNFSFPLAKALPEVEVKAVELDAGSVEAGNARASDSDWKSRVRFSESKVESWLAVQPPASRTTAILLDPPRVGCAPEAVERLAASEATFAVYVSCHPVTLARDLRAFQTKGWRLLEVQPFDMFPQTDHVESAVVLERAFAARGLF